MDQTIYQATFLEVDTRDRIVLDVQLGFGVQTRQRFTLLGTEMETEIVEQELSKAEEILIRVFLYSYDFAHIVDITYSIEDRWRNLTAELIMRKIQNGTL